MTVLRATWLSLAMAAGGFALWVGSWSAGDVSLECNKVITPELSEKCASSVVHVFGVWHIAGLAAILALPPLAAAVALRCWVSWLAVAAFAVIPVVGLMLWDGFWGTLMFAALFFLVAVLLAGIQQLVASDDATGPRTRSALARD